MPVGERELWLVTIGGDLRALTATYAEEGEAYRVAVDLWPLPVAP